MKDSTEEKLKKLASTIYETGVELFGVQEGRKTQPNTNKVESRRERRMKQLRKDKKDLRKRWREAMSEEKEGLAVLYEDLKKK